MGRLTYHHPLVVVKVQDTDRQADEGCDGRRKVMKVSKFVAKDRRAQ
eukprot:SAG11_NODE_38263_length_253_cov_0.662338_1_plen_46_part_10